jgi:hypothetical protein
MYLQRTFQLEPLLGKNYKYESVVIGEEADDVVKAYEKIEEDLKVFLDIEKTNQPVKTGESPF